MADRAASAALFLDFDGTLSPIVADPGAARPLPGVPAVLAALAVRFATVAVVSGRPVGYLVDRLGPADGVHLAGLYGLEERPPGGVTANHPGVAPWEPVVRSVIERARAVAPPGLLVEPKRLTVTLHWRSHPELEGWARDFAREAQASEGLEVHEGRMEVELRPPVPADKGTVVDRMAPGHEAAACFGDDVGDLPAFAALARLGAAGMVVATVAVGDPETPAAVLRAADVVVDGPRAALAALEAMAG